MRPTLGGGEPRLLMGVPDEWIDADWLRVYRKLGTPLGVPAVDPDDPPLFESEPTYLRRLGLLLAGELRRLGDDDFEPVPLTEILDLELRQ